MERWVFCVYCHSLSSFGFSVFSLLSSLLMPTQPPKEVGAQSPLTVPVAGRASDRYYKHVSEDRSPAGAVEDETGFRQGKASQTRHSQAVTVLYSQLWAWDKGREVPSPVRVWVDTVTTHTNLRCFWRNYHHSPFQLTALVLIAGSFFLDYFHSD